MHSQTPKLESGHSGASETSIGKQLIPVELVQHFRRAIINIHPGLLPAFGGKGLYGQRVHKAVVASGARFTGISCCLLPAPAPPCTGQKTQHTCISLYSKIA